MYNGLYASLLSNFTNAARKECTQQWYASAEDSHAALLQSGAH